jgi:hypothetical protein
MHTAEPSLPERAVSRPVSRFVLPFVLVAVAVTLPARRAEGQTVLDTKAAAVIRDEYTADLDTVHAKIMALANAIPEE